jgi:hypothetical protein
MPIGHVVLCVFSCKFQQALCGVGCFQHSLQYLEDAVHPKPLKAPKRATQKASIAVLWNVAYRCAAMISCY